MLTMGSLGKVRMAEALPVPPLTLTGRVPPNDSIVQVSLSVIFKGLFIYTVGFLCHVELFIRQLWSSSILLYNITA